MNWWDWMPCSSYFECWVLRQLFHSPLSPSLRCSLVPSSSGLIEMHDMLYYSRCFFFSCHTCYDYIVLLGAWRNIPTENWVPHPVPFAVSHDNTSQRCSFKHWTWYVNWCIFMNCTNSLKSSPSCSLKYNESFCPYLFWCQNAFMFLWKHIFAFCERWFGRIKCVQGEGKWQ